MKNRSIYEVTAAILKSVGKEATQTKIMYRAMLSGHQCKMYLDWIIRCGLVKEVKGNRKTFYKVTPKGTRFLSYYDQLKELLPGPIEENLVAEHHVNGWTAHLFKRGLAASTTNAGS